jgi:hypothetical protein
MSMNILCTVSTVHTILNPGYPVSTDVGQRISDVTSESDVFKNVSQD